MTEGELQAEKLEPYANNIKKYAFPLACVIAPVTYFTVNPNIYFCVAVFMGLLIIAFDEYWQATKLLADEDRLVKLKAITSTRKAAVFVNGGIIRELKHGLLLLAIIVMWIYF